MDWLNGWFRDMVYMASGLLLAFLIAIAYTLAQIVNDWLQRKYTQQAKQPQKVSGEVKQPMGFL
jgi:hypothetical protein